MSTKKELRKVLLEGDDGGHSYGCVMLNLDVSDTVWNQLLGKISDEDVYQPVGDRSYGKEDEPHVTVLYGLHSDIPDETIEDKVAEMTAPSVTLNKISIFENEDFDVIKFDVESPDLNKMNKSFSELPHTTDYPDYHPHVTIAYVKAGKGEKYVGRLDKPVTVHPQKIKYSKANEDSKYYDFKK